MVKHMPFLFLTNYIINPSCAKNMQQMNAKAKEMGRSRFDNIEKVYFTEENQRLHIKPDDFFSRPLNSTYERLEAKSN